MKKIVLFFAATLVSFSLLASPSFAEGIWEYKVVNLQEGIEAQMMAMGLEQLNALLGGEKNPQGINQTEVFLGLIEKQLNNLGNAGWELVSVEKQLAIFKRQKGK